MRLTNAIPCPKRVLSAGWQNLGRNKMTKVRREFLFWKRVGRAMAGYLRIKRGSYFDWVQFRSSKVREGIGAADGERLLFREAADLTRLLLL